MGITVVCQSCGNRRTVPSHLYDEKIRGRIVKIACKSCQAMISVDGTIPPPPGADLPGTPQTEDPVNTVIPEMARLPSEYQPGRDEAAGAPRAVQTNPKPSDGQLAPGLAKGP